MSKEELEGRRHNLTKNVALVILGICGMSFAIRLIYFPYGIPITLDSLNYFWYASDISNLKGFPSEYGVGNNGWPIFLSGIFSLFKFDNFLTLMTLQRFVTVIISLVTIVLVYLLCRSFFEKKYAVIGALIFALEPRIIQNSIIGSTDPFYIILVTASLVLFFRFNKKYPYLSFISAGLAVIVRSEGVFLFGALSIAFFIINEKEHGKFLKYTKMVAVYLSVILPIIFLRIKNDGSDMITGRIPNEINDVLNYYSYQHGGLEEYMIHAVINFVKLGGWSLIPMFIFFLPIGSLILLKRKETITTSVLVIVSILLIPVFYSFSVANDTRYIYNLFPLFIIISIFTIKMLNEKIHRKNIFLIILSIMILLGSIMFLEFKKIDYEHEREAFNLAKEIVKKANGVNGFYPESTYIEPAGIPEKWPVLRSSITSNTLVFSTYGFDSMEKFIKENVGLSHIIVDGDKRRPIFLNDVFYDDSKYKYLEKVFDSSEMGYKYHVKIYKINYDMFKQEQIYQ